MKPSTVFYFATFAAIAKSAALNKRQSVATCYGDKGPNLKDCKSNAPVQIDNFAQSR